MPYNYQSQKILIVGAGPVGMTLAILLAQNHFDVTLIDKGTGPQGLSKATGLWPAALKVFAQVGILEQLESEGVFIQQSHFLDHHGRELLSLNNSAPARAAQRLFVIQQNRLEELLIERLKALGVRIHDQTELVDIALHHLPTGAKPETIFTGKSASYLNEHSFDLVCACDGAKSTVVKKTLGEAGIKKHRDPRVFYATDVWLDWQGHPDNETYGYFATSGIRFFIPLPSETANPGKQLYRVTGICIDKNEQGQFRPPTPTELLQMLAKHGASANLDDIVQLPQGFPVIYKQVQSYHFPLKEPVVCYLGDAAHTGGPEGAQGISTGVMDAQSLARILLAGDDLANYHIERFKWGTKAIDTSKKAATITNMPRGAAVVRNLVLQGLFSLLPPLRHKVEQRLQAEAMRFE